MRFPISLRGTLACAILLSCGLALYMTIRWKLNVIALSATSSDNATEAFYLLSTLVQALAGVFAISIAVLFLAAQIYTRPQYARAVSEIYNDFLLWVTVLTFLVALGFGVFLITKVNWVVSSGLYYLLTSEVVLSGTALCLFLIAVSEQVANIDPYRFAQRLAQKISVRKILRYKFSDVAYDRDKGTVAYQLHVYGYLHGRSDPLAPIHEIVLWAVKNRDRVAMSALIRLLLSVVARGYGVPYRPTAERDPRPGRVHSIRRRGYMVVCRPLSVEHGVAVALFILTYVVRRAQRLIEEWEGLDIVRQQYILNIRDLIRALAYRTKGDVAIRLCLYAVLHICLSYSKVKRYGADEALRH